MHIKYVRESSLEFKAKALSAWELLINPTWWWHSLSNNVDDDGRKVRHACNFILVTWWYIRKQIFHDLEKKPSKDYIRITSVPHEWFCVLDQ